MANYTIDDIEILRKKSGITYEEAVNLPEYHNGSLARSLVDLERNGRMKEDGAMPRGKESGFKKILGTLFRLRVMIQKDGITVANLSSLFWAVTVMVAPHIAFIALAVSLLLGYRISIDRNSSAFSSDTFDSVVGGMKTNVQNTFNSFSRSFSQESSQTEQDAPPQRPHTEAAASGTRPVNVQFPGGGSVDVRDEGDGYHEADIN